jgi:hypothetical protein
VRSNKTYRVPIHRVLVTVLFILVADVCHIRVHAQQASAKLSADVEDLLWWLPPDTETLQVTRTRPKPQRPLVEAIEHTFGDIGTGAAYAHKFTQVVGARINIRVVGSRHFLPPGGLGDMRFEGAEIFVFDKPLGASLPGLLADLEKIAVKVEQIEGLRVLEFHDEIENATWSSYITIPRADVLVVATDRVYLEELLRRRVARAGVRAFTSELPEWGWLDTSAPFWAIRHYRHTQTTGDPTSPFTKTRSGDEFDPAAMGVATYAKSDGRTIVTHYLSRADNAEEIARRLWHHPGDGVAPISRRVSPEAIEVLFSAKDEETLSMFFFYLMGTLGHAIYL